MRNLDDWMDIGGHLPPFLRDFHDQKNVFQTLDEVAQKSRQNGSRRLDDLNWTTAHVYTVDVFLWTMAKHGYTLQRSRQKREFSDIGNTVRASVVRCRDASMLVLRSAFQKR